MHGGSLSAASEGLGARRDIHDPPAARGTGGSAPQSPADESAPARRLRVLVVDDNVDVAQTTGWLLEAIGHDYEIVNDGRLAVEAAVKFDPDAVLLDLGLPGMDGYAVCRALRSRPPL